MSESYYNRFDVSTVSKESTGSIPLSKMGSESLLGWISYTITSIGNFSIQYNFQAISVALLIMSSSLCTSKHNLLSYHIYEMK